MRNKTTLNGLRRWQPAWPSSQSSAAARIISLCPCVAPLCFHSKLPTSSVLLALRPGRSTCEA
uniref:Uncharacterized protein n=1 Tax=Arundo donax TaxID=35708 RepID=A0A0A8YN05_ARUDO